MPRSINEGFDDFNDNLKLVKTESEAIKTHRASIKTCLENRFEMDRFFRTGSIGNGTNVNGYSDTDYFAGIPRKNLKENSFTTLRLVKEALQERFPKTENIHVDSPAVVIPFGRAMSETTEIIPADFLRTENDTNIYDIADGSGGWLNASPKAHKNYVSEVNKRLNFKVKPLIRFIKAWKFYRNVPISSFYIEMRVAKYAYSEKAIVYSIDLEHILKYLLDIDLAPMVDPVGISGYINAYSSEAQKVDALTKLERAYKRAREARNCEIKEDIKGAFEWWGLLYNGKFPSYYY